ncbi:MAG TPA: hypothetical protein VK673_07870 [Chthoniobacterales bacterium]|nr:hypothetical protein [Chthoniobacterales bacterium]
MKSTLRSIFRSGLFATGFHASRATNVRGVQNLIEKLHPLDCGFDLIRVGSTGDGGYLIPNDLDGIEYCFSPGVSDLANFESQLADLNIKSFLADYSVASLPLNRQEFIFDKKFLGSSDRDPYFTLATWKEKYLKGYTGDLLLQMDIEGYEYETILSTPETLLDQFRIMVIEFHELDKIFDAFVFQLISSCFEKLLQSFYVVHIHPNNTSEVVKRGDIAVPAVMEFTFLNKRRAKRRTAQTTFPHPLDADCGPALRHIALPKCWYA